MKHKPMFNETAYFSDAANPGGIPLWQLLGYPSKAVWKQEGKQATGTFVPPALPGTGGGPTLLPDGSGGTITGAGTGATLTSSGSIGDLLSFIPTSYLLIGGAIILLMVLKK